jgi:hypothetical protein
MDDLAVRTGARHARGMVDLVEAERMRAQQVQGAAAVGAHHFDGEAP